MFKRYWWMLLVMLPVGAMIGFLMAAVVTYVMPKKYESSATIEVKPQGRTIEPMSGSHSPDSMSPQFFGTEFEKIKSRNTLMKVVDALDLTNKWGLDRESVLQILRAIVTTENIQGTDLISIRVRHTNKEDTRDIAAEVARAYKEYREELESEPVENRILELKKAVREQEDMVEERRKIIETIKRTEDVIYESPIEEETRAAQSEDGATYENAGEQYETSKALLVQMRLKLTEAEIENDIQEDSIIVHDDPVIADSPVSPNVKLNLLIGILGGALLSPLAVLPVMWLMNRKHVAAGF
ncbi:MAG: Wzz/FepE/Etk N-terminal domain-containing protein [Luteolibacter sp.]